MSECLPEDVLLDHLEGVLPPSESAVADEHLARCAACRAILFDLRILAETEHADRPEPSPASEAKVFDAIARVSERTGLRRSNRRLMVQRLGALATAAAVLLAIGLFVLESQKPRAVGRLALAHQGVVLYRNGVEQPAVAGMPLYRNDAIESPEDGSAVVVLEDATRLELGPGTSLAMDHSPQPDSDDLHLASGFLDVEAPRRPSGHPLRIHTPGARAEVLGTRFTLAAQAGRTATRVETGRVRLVRSRDGAAVDVLAGHRAASSEQGQLVSTPTRSGTVLLIVSRENAAEDWDRFTQLIGTRLVSDRLRQLSLGVEVMDHNDVRPEDLKNRPFVIVSHAEEGVGLEASLRRIRLNEAPVPVICLEAIALPVLKMSGTQIGTDYRWDDANLPLALREPAHPLAAGLDASWLDQVPCYGWAVPGPGVDNILGIAHDEEKSVAFGYELGSAMTGAMAPARRVGLMLNPARMTDDDDPAWLLFETAVNWCADPAAAPRELSGPPSNDPSSSAEQPIEVQANARIRST